MRNILIALMLATPAMAQDPMNAAEFEAYTTGKTLTFGTIGDETYGIERYMKGRRVVWSFGDGICERGVWYAQDDEICFEYDGNDTPQCWKMYAEPSGLRAEFTNVPDGRIINEAKERDEPLICNDLFS